MVRLLASWVLTIGLAFVAVPAMADDGKMKAADAAYAAGDQAGALRLYDEVLAAEPQNLQALLRSAQLLSWNSRFAEAVTRYERALAINGSDVNAMLERAKILSWTRRYDEAVAGFGSVLARDAANREARLGLARTLSWSGRLAESRREYEQLLATNANDADALVGVAQTYAWSGDQANGRTWYLRALEADPASLGANLGLAYADLAAGNRRSASVRAQELATRYPNDKDVRDLGVAVRASSKPRFELGQELSEDSDRNDLKVSRVRATVPAGRADVTATVARFLMDSGVRDGSVDTAHLQATIRPTASQRLTLRAGVDRAENSLGNRKNYFTGTVSYGFGSERRLALVLLADRDFFKYSVPILDSGIEVETLAFRTSHASDRWLFDAGASTAEFSDDNERLAADGVLLYRWPGSKLSIATGLGVRYLDFDRASFGGYFDPQDYTATTLQLRIGKRFASRVEFNLSAEGGLQSFDHRGVSTEDDRFAGANATLTLPLGEVVLLDLSAAKSQSAISAASGFESTVYSVRLRMGQ